MLRRNDRRSFRGWSPIVRAPSPRPEGDGEERRAHRGDLAALPLPKRIRRAETSLHLSWSFSAHRFSITTSRYSLGKTRERSCERLPCSTSWSTSRVKVACLSASSAPKVLL